MPALLGCAWVETGKLVVAVTDAAQTAAVPWLFAEIQGGEAHNIGSSCAG